MESIKVRLQNKPILEILEKEVMKFGKSGHIIIPQKHLNKKVFVVVPE